MRILTQPNHGLFPNGLNQNRAGMALTECLVYIALFFMVVGLAFVAYERTQDTSKKLRKSAEDIASSLHAGERWREDIRQAKKEPVIVGDSMQITQSDGEVRYLFREGKIFRQGPQMQQPAPVLSGVKNSRMVKDAGQSVTSWRWEVELATKEKSPRLQPLFTFQAVAPVTTK